VNSGFGGGGASSGSLATSFQGGSSAYGGPGGAAGEQCLSTNVGNFYRLGGASLNGFGGKTGRNGHINAWQSTTLAYGDSKWVSMLTDNCSYATSTDGTTWTVGKHDLPGISLLPGLLYDGSQWVGLATGQVVNNVSTTAVYTSANLNTWTLEGGTPQATSWIAYYSNTYVAVGGGGVIYSSTDLINWTARTSGTTENLNHVIHDGTRWIIVGNAGVSLTSTDAATWTLVTTSSAGNWLRVASDGTSTFVATSTLTPFAWRSTNTGSSWSSVSTTLTANGSIVYGNSIFAIAAASIIYTSAAGATWTTQTDGTTDSYGAIGWSGSLFFAVSNTVNTNTGIRSSNGTSWSTSTLTEYAVNAEAGGSVTTIAGGGGGGGASLNGYNSGAGGSGGNGLVRVYSW
jgi:hypothetical protein